MNYYMICILLMGQMILITNQSPMLSIYDILIGYENQQINQLNPQLRKNTVQLNKRPQALSILMYFNLDGTSSFNLLDNNGIYWSDMGNCAHGQMFDPISGVCRDIFCMEDFYVSESGCQSNKTKLQTYIPDEIKIELNLNNKLCVYYPFINEKEDCDTNSIEMDHDLKERLRFSIARELDINLDRISDFTVSNKSIIHEKFKDDEFKTERFRVAFKILDKKLFPNEEQDSIIVYFKLIAMSLMYRLFKINDEQFSISDVIEITENKYLSWCSDQDKRKFYSVGGFKILTLPEKADLNHNYYIYVEEDNRLYEKGEYYLTVFYDPVFNVDKLIDEELTQNWLSNLESQFKSIDTSKRWNKNSSYLDITDYVLNVNSSRVSSQANLVVCDQLPAIRTECNTHKIVRIKKCEIDYDEMTRKYCSSKLRTCFAVNSYEIDQVYPDKYIRICKDSVEKSVANLITNDEAIIDQITSWLSFLSILVSIVFLFATLITYMLFASLRKLPAWNVINLTLALFVAQLSFALGSFLTEDGLPCFLISILTHYGFLAAFFWMNISAFDLYRNFCFRSKQILLNMVTPRERLPKYLIYGWLGPVLIVLICLTIDLTNDSKISDSLRPCYAGYLKGCLHLHDNNNIDSKSISDLNQNQTDLFNLSKKIDDCYDLNEVKQRYIFIKSCYIQNGRANLIFFGLPIGLIIIVNAVFYSLTIYNIRKMKSKQKQSYLRRVSRGKVASDDDVKFYIQMAFTMGFTWIFGFLSSTYTVDESDRMLILYQILVFCFIISNGLIGILIFFAFIFKKEVFFLYKQLFLEKIFCVKQKHKVQNVYSIKITSTDYQI